MEIVPVSQFSYRYTGTNKIDGHDKYKEDAKVYLEANSFEGFSVSNSKGFTKAMTGSKVSESIRDSWSRTKPGVDSLSFDDLYNNLRVFKSDVKGSTASSLSSQNVAFVSENTSSTNDLPLKLDHEDFQELVQPLFNQEIFML
ncbi:hypothetical protein Tco_0039088 [Tanacetum coccineum]